MNRAIKWPIRRDDQVVVRAGRSAGQKPAKVLQVLPERGRAIVEGLQMARKCVRKNQEQPKGAIIDKEMPIAIANLMLYCPQCKRGVRAAHPRKDGRRSRVCKRCGHAFD